MGTGAGRGIAPTGAHGRALEAPWRAAPAQRISGPRWLSRLRVVAEAALVWSGVVCSGRAWTGRAPGRQSRICSETTPRRRLRAPGAPILLRPSQTRRCGSRPHARHGQSFQLFSGRRSAARATRGFDLQATFFARKPADRRLPVGPETRPIQRRTAAVHVGGRRTPPCDATILSCHNPMAVHTLSDDAV